jgi:hypothetical protein
MEDGVKESEIDTRAAEGALKEYKEVFQASEIEL